MGTSISSISKRGCDAPCSTSAGIPSVSCVSRSSTGAVLGQLMEPACDWSHRLVDEELVGNTSVKSCDEALSPSCGISIFCGYIFTATPKDTRGRAANSSWSFSSFRRSSSSRSALSSSSLCLLSTCSRCRHTTLTVPLTNSSCSILCTSSSRQCSSSRSLINFSRILSLSASAVSSRRLFSCSRALLSCSACFCISCCKAVLFRSCCAIISSSFRLCSSFTYSLFSATIICSYHGGVEVPSSSFSLRPFCSAEAAGAGIAPFGFSATGSGVSAVNGRKGPLEPKCANGTVFQTR
mmetsp:Transcript_39241/g.77676  ORF Transcript_39241/g.77676 Transcript_39241/m.77676 type:complete len:295 (+) Transcript_39241:922-1806(+)